MTAAIDITESQRKTLLAILRRHIPGSLVWAYGSRVKFTARPNSDLDLVVFTSPAQKRAVSDLKDDLAESTLPFIVDVHVWDEVPEKFHDIIRKEYVVVQEVELSNEVSVTAWPLVPLGDVITLQRGFDLPSQNRKPGKVPIVSSSGISDYHSEVGVKGPGVVTGRYGTIGQVFLIKEDFWPLNTTLWVKDFHGNDPHFASYLLRTVDFQSCSDKSSVPGVNRNDLHRIPVLLPPLAEQKAIAAVLGALDDKIELNRRMNATLEAMARALFQSWFVDFDPVRAKLDGRQPVGMDEATAALFPEQLEDSPLGHIPKGWKAGRLGDIGTNSRRSIHPCDIAPNTPYIALEHMPRRCIALGDWADSADVVSGKSAFKKGEILFGKLRPYFHKVGVAPFDGVCSTDILVLTPKGPEWFGFLLGHASSDELIQFTDLASTGTKMPRTNWSDISSFKVALPPKSIAVAFTRVIEPMLDRIQNNLHQSRTLATLRDTLLPKLMSGEVGVASTL